MTKILKALGWSLTGLVAVALLVASGALRGEEVAAQAPPSRPARFAGNVLVDGVQPAAGTVIEARIGGASCGAGAANADGTYLVEVQPIQPAAPTCGVVDLSVVEFWVGGKKANESGVFKDYQANILNLTVTSPTPSPSPSPTPKPPTTGSGMEEGTGVASTSLLLIIGVVALGLGLGGATVARRSR